MPSRAFVVSNKKYENAKNKEFLVLMPSRAFVVSNDGVFLRMVQVLVVSNIPLR